MMPSLFPYAPRKEVTEETSAVVVEMTRLLMTLQAADRLNAVVAIACLWTDFRDIREGEPWDSRCPVCESMFCTRTPSECDGIPY